MTDLAPADLPRRVAQVVHALMEQQASHVADSGRLLMTAGEVMEYDHEALTVASTRAALRRALAFGLADKAGRYWFPTRKAWDMRRALEDLVLGEEGT